MAREALGGSRVKKDRQGWVADEKKTFDFHCDWWEAFTSPIVFIWNTSSTYSFLNWELSKQQQQQQNEKQQKKTWVMNKTTWVGLAH